MTADKKDNYLNGYCTGQTDLLQAMIDQAPAAYMYDQARYGPTDLRGQQWLPELSRLKPYEGNGMVRDVTPLYTTPPQLEERNFCPRCGKRTADLTVIHTCTPPQENT